MDPTTTATTSSNNSGSDKSTGSHSSNSPHPTFSVHQPHLNSFHQRNSKLLYPTPFFDKQAAASSPPSYEYPLQSYELLDQQPRPGSADNLSRGWATSASPSSPCHNTQAVVGSGTGRAPASESTSLTSASTPPIGFDSPTPVSALPFSQSSFFPQELSPIPQGPRALGLTPPGSDISSHGPKLPPSASFHACTSSWASRQYPVVNHLSASCLASSNASLTHSDPFHSDSSSRSWTPDQTDKPQSSARLPDPQNGSQNYKPLGSPVAASLHSYHTQSSGQEAHFRHRERVSTPLLNGHRSLTDYSRHHEYHCASLMGPQSPFDECAESFVHPVSIPSRPSSIGPGTTGDSYHNSATSLCSPVTPHHMTASALGHLSDPHSLGVPPAWLESDRHSRVDSEQSQSEHGPIRNLCSIPHARVLPSRAQTVQPLQLTQSPNITLPRGPSHIMSPVNFNTPESCSGNIIQRLPERDTCSSGSSGGGGVERLEMNVNAVRGGTYNKKKKREVHEAEAICGICGGWMARLTLRGNPEDLRVVGGYEIVHTCKACQEGKRGGTASSPRNIGHAGPPPFAEQRPSEHDDKRHSQATPDVRYQPVVTTFRKRNRRTDDVTAPTTCDCCARQLGVGGIVPRNGRSAIQFGVEVVCNYCVRNFRRCTDCGGGGGTRLGVGKWRCKELFSEGRRTCILSHQRQGASAEVRNVVWKVNELVGKVELDTLVTQLRELVKHSLYAALATPEMLESGLARVSTFEDIKTMYFNGWKQIEPLIRDDIENKVRRRRYLGLKWTKPHPRKGPKRIMLPNTPDSVQHPDHQSSSILEPGKELSGFVLAEWDMNRGTFFVSLAMPWQSGDAIESTAELTNKVFLEAVADREDLIEELVVQHGIDQSEATTRYPPIQHLWTILFFSREARLVQFLEKRKRFLPLDDYLDQYPDAQRSMFPPHRECYVPIDEQKGWHVWVRRETGLGPRH